MKLFILLVFAGCIIHHVTAPPVTTKKPEEEREGFDNYVEYHRYLAQVVEALETDSEFRDKLQKAEESDILSGKIAHELDFVNHNVRTKLDELKRQELERLRHLATKQFELQNDLDTDHAKVSVQLEHLDHNNPHTFEIEDLKKLIMKATEDLMEADKKRRSEFKEYEMQKEFDKQQKMQTLDETHKKEYEKEIHDMEEKHKKHEPLHHPGSRQQLEEVWEKQDHMDSQVFDPKTFFMLHDVDGNGVWDQVEVKALFVKELDKLYNSGLPEDDIRERQEEMERMREHVFRESDTNRDGFISYEEFLTETRKTEFEKDEGWKGLDEQQLYTPEEYHDFEKKRLEDLQRMVQQGLIPPPQYQGQPYHPQAGYQQQQYPQYQQQYHPNAIPQGQFQPPPNYNQQGQVHHPQQGYPQQGYPQQGQFHPQQAQGQPQPGQAHGQVQQGQVPQAYGPGQQQQGQVPQTHGQVQQQQGQVPQTHGQAQQQQGPAPQTHGQVQQQQGPVPQTHGQGQQQQGQVQPQGQVQQPQGQIPVAPVQNLPSPNLDQVKSINANSQGNPQPPKVE